MLQIGELAKRSGVNIQTIRYYERLKLLQPAIRRDSGYRIFNEDAIKRIQFIKNAQKLGFTLKEINELLSLRVDKRTNKSAVRQKAEQRLADIQDKIADLDSMKNVLSELLTCCRHKKNTTKCPILQSFET